MGGLCMVSGGAATLTAASAWVFRNQLPFSALVALVHAACSGFVVSICSSDALCDNTASITQKDRTTGKMKMGTRLVAWPFFGILHLRLSYRRSRSKEPILQQVGDGWYIGGWPRDPSVIPDGPLCIVDCTNEYQRTAERPYICLPTWDTQGVSPSNIKKAVDFAMEQRRLGRAVLVHCAHGHGRSAGVILACMIVAGDVPNIDDGLRQIQGIRPKVKLNGMQRRNLEKYLSTVSKTP